jgi:hypothetical protein
VTASRRLPKTTQSLKPKRGKRRSSAFSAAARVASENHAALVGRDNCLVRVEAIASTSVELVAKISAAVAPWGGLGITWIAISGIPAT